MGKCFRNAGLLVLVSFLCALAQSYPVQAEVISEGVYIDGVNVGGMTEKQAAAEEENYLQELANTKVTVYVNDKAAETTLGELGLTTGESCVEKAVNVGREGNLVERYMELQDAQEETLEYRHKLNLDTDAVKDFVEKKCMVYNAPAQNARIHQKADGTLKITPSISGVRLVEDETVEKIRRTILDDWDRTSKLVIDAIIMEEMPAFNSETAGQCTDLLGSFTTEYKSSGESRVKNIENAAQLIDGSVLFPGQEFSVYRALYPITEENGFEPAGSYSEGKVVQSVGGGICQVSTTLYDAVLWSELEIVQRNEHSMAVKYVDLAMDAAIAGSYKDLKFRNSLNAPVYIEAVTKDKTITFRIWGREVRPAERTIDFETDIEETIQPGDDVIIYDDKLEKGTGYVSQDAYTGYRASLYKIISKNGEEQERVLINKSQYAATPRYIVAGSKGDAKKGTEKTSEEKQEKSVDGLKEAIKEQAET